MLFRLLLLLLLPYTLVFADLELSDKELAWLKENRTVTYAYDPDWAPFEWKTNNFYHAGIIYDLLHVIRQRSGINFVPKYTQTWTQSIEYVKNGTADMFSAITYSEDRAKYLNFTKNDIYSYPAVLLTKFDDKNVYIDIEKDCKDKRIGIVQSSGLGEYIKKTYPTLNFVILSSTKEGFDAILSNKIDLFAINTVTSKYLIEKLYFGNIKIATKLDFTYHLKIAVHKNISIELISILDKALQSISEKEMNAIFNKWTSVTVQNRTNWKLIIQIFSFFLVILFFLLWHNKKLKKLVKQKTIELKILSETDHLTGLRNRRQFEKDFLYESIRAARFNKQMALYFIDVDNFKIINDKFGHDIGDTFLILISKSLKESLRETELLYRIGGDEFCVLLPTFTDKQQLEKIALRLIEVVESVKTEMGKDSLPIGFSIGISIFPDNGKDLKTLLTKADKAMYEIKQSTKNSFSFVS